MSLRHASWGSHQKVTYNALGEVTLMITVAKTVCCPLISFFRHMLKQHELCDMLGVNTILHGLIFCVACVITIERYGRP